MADILYASLRPAVSAVLDGIHSHEHVGTASVLTGEPGLKCWARYHLSLGDPLDCMPRRAIAHQDRGVVCGFKQLSDVFRGGQRARGECGVGAHG